MKGKRNVTTNTGKKGPKIKTEIQPTDEQSAIIKSAATIQHPYNPNETSPKYKGKVVRVTAAAGTGKTTTLEMASIELLKQGHRVLYLVFNKAAQEEAYERIRSHIIQQGYGALISNIKCSTMHAVALQKVIQIAVSSPNVTENEESIKSKLPPLFEKDIRKHIYGSPNDHKEKNSNEIESDIRLVCHYIFKSLIRWLHSPEPVNKLTKNDWYTYYPCKLQHEERWKCPHGMFYVMKAKEVWDLMWEGKIPVLHDAYMKLAQLSSISLEYDTVLIDEAQDANLCQLDLFVKQQHKAGKNIFIVGDAVQAIYSFRGAQSKFLRQLDQTITDIVDHQLSKTFRFGKNIASVANQLLFVKEYSPQGSDFIPYRISGLSKIDGHVSVSEPLDYPYTCIARTNAQLFIEALMLLAEDMELKIAINGDLRKFQKIAKEVVDLFHFKKGASPTLRAFKKYKRFLDFIDDCKRLELKDKYAAHLALLEKLGEELPEKIACMREKILESPLDLSDASVILSTVHQAKGLEYDNVKLSDDFIDLEVCSRNEIPTKFYAPFNTEACFRLPANGDDLNLWYVAVTRAKKKLLLPQKWLRLQRFIKFVSEAVCKREFDKNVLKEYSIEKMDKFYELFERMREDVGDVLFTGGETSINSLTESGYNGISTHFHRFSRPVKREQSRLDTSQKNIQSATPNSPHSIIETNVMNRKPRFLNSHSEHTSPRKRKRTILPTGQTLLSSFGFSPCRKIPP
jgi:F-box protein 18 (helicase)